MPLLVDTGVLYALADKGDAWHARTRAYIESTRDTLLAPVTIVPEVAYLLRDRIGPHAEQAFAAAIAGRELAIQDLRIDDWNRAGQLMAQYEQIGLVDATIVAIAERLKLTLIATTDRRHFEMIQPVHTRRFRLVP
jgi:predicted nucleic acid-binding protein